MKKRFYLPPAFFPAFSFLLFLFLAVLSQMLFLGEKKLTVLII